MSEYCGLQNGTTSPLYLHGPRAGKWKPAALELCGALGIEPTDAWPRYACKATARHQLTKEQIAAIVHPQSCPPPPDIQVERKDLIAKLLASALTQRQRYVIRMRFGLDGHRPMTLAQLAACCKLTVERIRQIEAHAMRRLRHPSSLRRLRHPKWHPAPAAQKKASTNDPRRPKRDIVDRRTSSGASSSMRPSPPWSSWLTRLTDRLWSADWNYEDAPGPTCAGWLVHHKELLRPGVQLIALRSASNRKTVRIVLRRLPPCDDFPGPETPDRLSTQLLTFESILLDYRMRMLQMRLVDQIIMSCFWIMEHSAVAWAFRAGGDGAALGRASGLGHVLYRQPFGQLTCARIAEIMRDLHIAVTVGGDAWAFKPPARPVI